MKLATALLLLSATTGAISTELTPCGGTTLSQTEYWYCSGTCGNWDGPSGCGQGDADQFCKLKTGNTLSTATSFSIVPANIEVAPGVCCPPPILLFYTDRLGCTDTGIVSESGVQVWCTNNLGSGHGGGRTITNLVCAVSSPSSSPTGSPTKEVSLINIVLYIRSPNMSCI